MKIERINDNQIRCTLTSLDLSSRGINLAELAYGSEKARNLFREMIQQAAQEVGFEAEDIPLMVEAIPLSSESIMLIVTKVEDPEELDTRFSKFSPFAEAESENLLSQLADEFLEGAGDLAKLLGQNGTEELKANVNTAAENTGTENAKAPQIQLRTFRFDSLDQISEAAKAAEDKVTKDALELSDRLFQHFKDYEKLMEKQLEAAGRKSDPYRASKPDNYKDPEEPKKPDTPTVPEKPQIREDANKVYIPAPNYVATSSTRDIPANAEGNPNNRFGYAANKEKQPVVSPKVETPVKPEEKVQAPTEAPVAGNSVNNNNRFGSNFNPGEIETYSNTNYSYNVHP